MIGYNELDPKVITADYDANSIKYKPLVYQLRHEDIFIVNYIAFKKTFGMSIRKIKLNEIMSKHFVCMEKIKRKHWWQFWKPRYTGVKVMYVEKENTKCKD
jgi:hypothetical protein